MLNGQDNKVAILAEDKKVTYGDMKKFANHYSTLFSDVRNTRVSIFSENRLEWIYAYYAIWQNQDIPVPIDYMAGIDDVSFIINDCTPEVIFCSKDRKPMLDKSLAEVNYSPRVIVFEDIEEPTAELEIPSPQFTHTEDDVAVIIYTSGTTGSPKGVMLTFGNLTANMLAISEYVNIYSASDRVMLLLPLHHIFPLLGSLIVTLYVGASVALAPSLNADDIIRTLQKHKVTIMIGVPRLYSLIRKGIRDKINQSKAASALFKIAQTLNSRTFSKTIFKSVHQKFGGSLQFMVAGGASLDPEVGKDFKTLGFDILEGYGMTEAAPMITFTRPGKFLAGSAGHALHGTKIEIRDGEVVASGKNIMKGYYNREDETADILKDGWLYTGDLGYLDKKGRIFITGRRKEIIVLSNGKNINPAEIELKIEKMSPLVKEAGVFMMKDKLNLVIVPDEKLLRKEKIENPLLHLKNQILKPYNDRATSSKRLLKLHISYEELPKTRLSKLQRFKLVEFVEALSKEEKKQHKEADTKELKTVLDFLTEHTGQAVYPDDRLEDDLALDSLAKVTLLVYLENTFGVKIEENDLYRFEKLSDLGNFIVQHKTHHTPSLIDWANILKEKIQFKIPKAGFSFNFINWSYRAFVGTLLQLKGRGLENVPEEGPCIIAANHQSAIDGFLLASLLKRKMMRHTYFYAKEKHWQTAFKRFLARKNNIILMDINRDLRLSLQKMAELLRMGKNIIIFPEGTRTGDGSLGKFKQSFAILARELNVPVVPVAINGSYEVLPAGKKMPRIFKKVSVDFMKPVYPEELNYDDLMVKVQEIIAAQVKES